MSVSRWFGRLIAFALVMGFGSALAAAPPDGPYRDSCNAVRASGGVLSAHCERPHGRRVWARLERYSTCVGDISNDKGQLICLRRRDVPGGSWSESCKNPHLAAPGVFGADCRSPRGGRIASQIPLSACPGGLTSSDGHLTCDKPRHAERHDNLAPAPKPPPEEPADERPQPSASDQPPPAGSYQQSCRDFDFDGRYLSGECRDQRGAWQDTSLDTRSCARDQEIGNKDGELVCARSQQGRTPPEGSYRQSCGKVTFDGRFLHGECRDAQGAWDKATLDMRPCHDGDDIADDDGELVCRRAQASAPAGGEQSNAPAGGEHGSAPDGAPGGGQK
jgi:hypothetical protein